MNPLKLHNREAPRSGLVLSTHRKQFPTVRVSARLRGRVVRLSNSRDFSLESTMEKIEKGFCQCGCGNMTVRATRNIKGPKINYVKGEHKKFIHGHWLRSLKVDKRPGWKGGIVNSCGYTHIYKPDHPSAYQGRYVRLSRYIVEQILGKTLPSRCVIHHVDGNGLNNKNNNLVVCQDDKYHALLHRRARALRACGNVNFRKCGLCKKWDNPQNMFISNRRSCHRECRREYERNYHKRKHLKEAI